MITISHKALMEIVRTPEECEGDFTFASNIETKELIEEFDELFKQGIDVHIDTTPDSDNIL